MVLFERKIYVFSVYSNKIASLLRGEFWPCITKSFPSPYRGWCFCHDKSIFTQKYTYYFSSCVISSKPSYNYWGKDESNYDTMINDYSFQNSHLSDTFFLKKNWVSRTNILNIFYVKQNILLNRFLSIFVRYFNVYVAKSILHCTNIIILLQWWVSLFLGFRQWIW